MSLRVHLETSPAGLRPDEAKARLARHGPNELQQLARISPLKIFLSQQAIASVVPRTVEKLKAAHQAPWGANLFTAKVIKHFLEILR